MSTATHGGNGRAPFRLKPYTIKAKPHYKFVVAGREAGKRKRRYFTTKGAASAYCDLKNNQAKNDGKKAAEFPSKLRNEAQECHDRLAPYGKRIKDATEFFVQHLEATVTSCSVAELIPKLIAAKKVRTKKGRPASERHIQDLESRLGIFKKKFGDKLVASVTKEQIEEWLSAFSAETRNHYLRLCKLLFNFAVEKKLAPENPAAKIESDKPIDQPPGILSVSEAANLLESAGDDVLPYVAIGLFAGLRRSEIEKLDWSDIHFDSDLIEVTAEKAKTARRRFVRMQPNLREWLLPVRNHKGRVVCDNFRKRFDATRDTAGIAEWPDNALRHSFASYHLAHFKDAAALALEMGHTDSGMIFEHYRQLVRPRDAERYWSLTPSTTEKVVQLATR